MGKTTNSSADDNRPAADVIREQEQAAAEQSKQNAKNIKPGSKAN